MSGLQKCPECPWTGYGVGVHFSVMHRSLKEQRERSRRIELIATLLEHADGITMEDIRRFSLILAELAVKVHEARHKEIEEQERIYNELRTKLLPEIGGIK